MNNVFRSWIAALAALLMGLNGIEQPSLAGTKWVDSKGYIYQFTEDGKRFHNWERLIIYQKTSDGYYHQTAIAQDGLITYTGYPLISFEQDSGILTMTISYENRDPHVQHYQALTDDASLAGTRWLHENGSEYVFSDDATLFTSADDDTILCMAYKSDVYHDCTFNTQYGFYRANTADEVTFTVADGSLIQTTAARDGAITKIRYTPAP